MEFIGPDAQDIERVVEPPLVNPKMTPPIEHHVKEILRLIGEDPEREGLRETPKRFAKWLKEMTSYEEFNFTTFEGENYDSMVIVRDIPFTSMCEHHMAPFYGKAIIGYIPNKKIVGLSKLPRALHRFSRRLQNQERITRQVAEFIQEQLDPLGVAVMLTAEHSCMSLRGVRAHGASTVTNCLLGVFRDDPKAREEFVHLALSK